MLRLVLVWIIAFVAISAIDALWHLVLFRDAYTKGLSQAAANTDGKLALRALPGLLSQVLVITALMVLALYPSPAQMTTTQAIVRGAMGGILAISVYGLVNHALIARWGLDITLLEVVWGPVIGALGGWVILSLYRLIA